MSTNRFLTIINGVRQLVTAISTSAGAGDANKIVATGSDGRLHSSLMPSGVGAATESIVTSEALAAGDFVNIWNNSGTRTVRKADASNSRPAHGFVLTAVSNGQNATVFTSGQNTALTSLTPGTSYFLSATTAGTATTTAPSSTGHLVQELGYAASATAITFDYDGFTSIA
jgi:hypothetical protein